MYWYGGSIAEAVTLSKQKNAIFVVFVEGDNELSTEMASTIDDAAVLTRLSNQSQFLAIKLKSGSPNYTHFAQIYQFVPVPSLFFIGRNGTPLEVVCAGVQPENLATRIDRILEEHYKDKPPMQPSTSAQNVREQTLNFLEGESASPAKTETAAPIKLTETLVAKESSQKTEETDKEAVPPPAKVVKKNPDAEEYECDGDVCVRKPNKPDEPGPSQIQAVSAPAPVETLGARESAGSIEEKLDRAKELIEARRREKAEKEKEQEKEKERERRTTGKGVAELKRWQAEQELKQIQEERRREKQEDNLARQRVLEQIARDRAERRARDAPAHPPAPQHQVPVQPLSGDGGNRARVQFKLPDGTSHTAHFDADGTLGDVQTYVTNNLQLPTASFSLWTAFPRRELTECTANLRSLGLAPSAALLVLPRSTDTVTPAPSYARVLTLLTHLFTTLILEPTQQLFNWIRARMFPPPAISRGNTPGPTNREPSPLGVRRRGNIHRLPSDRGNDDDNNTWNGNSTQQM